MGHWYNYRAIPLCIEFQDGEALMFYADFQCGM